MLLFIISFATVSNSNIEAGSRLPNDYYLRKLEAQMEVASPEEPEIPKLSKEEPGSGTMLHGTQHETVALMTRKIRHKNQLYGRMMKYMSKAWGNKNSFRKPRGNYNGLRILK